MEQKKKALSLAEKVYDQLEHDILSGKYKAGEVLTEVKLSEELGVSRTPIREALRRLSQENLIDDAPKGCIVRLISSDDLEDAFKIRAAIEGTACAYTAENINEFQLAELDEVLSLQEFYVARDNFDNVMEMDSQFHELIYKYCGRNILGETLAPLHKKLQRFRRAAITDRESALASFREHRAMFNAIAARDPVAARDAADDHVLSAFKRILLIEE